MKYCILLTLINRDEFWPEELITEQRAVYRIFDNMEVANEFVKRMDDCWFEIFKEVFGDEFVREESITEMSAIPIYAEGI